MSRKMMGFVLVGLSIAGEVSAQESYQRVPIVGGAILDLAFDPNSQGVAYAAVRGPGIYKSQDGGQSWSVRALPEVRPHAPTVVLPSRAEPGVVLVCEPNAEDAVGTLSNIYRSEDGGESFSAVHAIGGTGCTALSEGRSVGTYYAAGGQTPNVSLYTSTDSGLTWNETPLIVPEAFSEGDGISSLLELPTGRLVFTFAEILYDPDFFLADTGAAAYSDDGETLTNIPEIRLGAVDLSYNGSDTIFLFARGIGDPELWSSTDGATFTEVPFSDASNTYSPWVELRYVPERDAFLSLSSNRLLQSATAAETYDFDGGSPLTGGISSARQLSYLRTLAADPFDPEAWLVGTHDGGEGVVHRQGDVNSWKLGMGIDAAKLDHALYDPGTGYQYVAGNSGRILFAETGAQSFRSVFRGSGQEAEALTTFTYDLENPKRIIAALSRDSDAGDVAALLELPDASSAATDEYPGPHMDWVALAAPKLPEPQETISALLVSGQTIYVGYDAASSSTGGLYRSLDGGATYQLLPFPFEERVWMLKRHPVDVNVLYAGGGATLPSMSTGGTGLFRSNDAGDSWTQVAPEVLDQYISKLVFDPNDPAHFWVANTSSASDVWETLDGGTSFTEISPAGTSVQIHDLDYSLELGRVVIARDRGVFSYDPETTWEVLTEIPATPLALYAGARGIATDSGLYVSVDLLSEAGGDAATGGTDSSTDGASNSSTMGSSNDAERSTTDGEGGCSCVTASSRSPRGSGAVLCLLLGIGFRRAKRPPNGPPRLDRSAP